VVESDLSGEVAFVKDPRFRRIVRGDGETGGLANVDDGDRVTASVAAGVGIDVKQLSQLDA
jgi:hypothetical protein